jgi:hypothetical protein
MNKTNPFSHIRASDYTDDEINNLWVGFGPSAIDAVIEPNSRISKYILGGKGSGKTHVLRYHSFPVARKRYANETGLATLVKQKFLAVFLRAAAFDASRFENMAGQKNTWQQIFGIYFELMLIEEVVDALCEVQLSSKEDKFNDRAFLDEIIDITSNKALQGCDSLPDLLQWIKEQRGEIDDAINHWAFTTHLSINVPFNLGSAALKINQAIGKWHPSLTSLRLIYLIDEIENFSELQQEVVNTFIRYGEGQSTFRVTGRLYAVKTYATINSGEENREDSEYKVTVLDDILRKYRGYPFFARKFISNHLASSSFSDRGNVTGGGSFDPKTSFDEIKTENFYEAAVHDFNLLAARPHFIKNFMNAVVSSKRVQETDATPGEIVEVLTDKFPLILQKLNILQFCKKFSVRISAKELSQKIAHDCSDFLFDKPSDDRYYAVAYGHYAGDLFAQLFDEARSGTKLPYAGFDTFVKMSAGNPRNLLIILGRAYDIASFRGIDFIHDGILSTAFQTEAALASARVAYDKDAGYGPMAERAKAATNRFASVLRVARYALRIPEVSPLAVSFLDDDLSDESREVLQNAIHYSFIFENINGRRDRNTKRLNRKVQLNPMMAPLWGLSLGRRGDLKLNRQLLNCIFDPLLSEEFEKILRELQRKWNNPFRIGSIRVPQKELF